MPQRSAQPMNEVSLAASLIKAVETADQDVSSELKELAARLTRISRGMADVVRQGDGCDWDGASADRPDPDPQPDPAPERARRGD